jgi:AcrR family transcriptional regulator
MHNKRRHPPLIYTEGPSDFQVPLWGGDWKSRLSVPASKAPEATFDHRRRGARVIDGKHEKRQPSANARKPRADSARNHKRLIDAAKAAFSDVGPDVSLEEIARRAGVGIGTLYRHFPSRQEVLEAVYRQEVEQLAEAVPHLLESLGAREALHRWMHLFVDYIATKRLIAPSLAAAAGGPPALYASSAELITRAISTLVKRAVASGEVRKDVDPSDLLRAMVGVSYGYGDEGWEASARRLIDILMEGLRRQEG